MLYVHVHICICIIISVIGDIWPQLVEARLSLDETGADRRTALRQYGYSMCGRPLKKYSLLCNWNYVC